MAITLDTCSHIPPDTWDHPPESSQTPKADGLQYGCSKRAGERIPAPSTCAAFYLQRNTFFHVGDAGFEPATSSL